MKSILDKSIRGEKGQALILVLILLLVGSLILTPLLSFISTGLMAVRAQEERTLELYAADAGVEDALYKIVNGDALLPETVGDTWPYPIADVNGKGVGVVIEREEDIESFLEGLLDEVTGGHSEWTVITDILAPGIYEITVTWDPPPPGHGNKKINGVGAWLQGDYEYVADSASGMTDDYPVFTFRTESYKGGTAFIWEWTAANHPVFGIGDSKSLSFEFMPRDIPGFYFSWFVGGSSDVGLVVGAQTFGIWKFTATATDSTTGKETEVISYVSSSGTAAPYAVEILTWESSVLQ